MTDSTIRSIQDLIDALGGREAVANLLKIEPSAVSMWGNRGFIPTGWHARLVFACWKLPRAIDPAVFELPADIFNLPPGAFDVVVPSPPPMARANEAAPRRRRNTRRVA